MRTTVPGETSAGGLAGAVCGDDGVVGAGAGVPGGFTGAAMGNAPWVEVNGIGPCGGPTGSLGLLVVVKCGWGEQAAGLSWLARGCRTSQASGWLLAPGCRGCRWADDRPQNRGRCDQFKAVCGACGRLLTL